MDGLSRHWLWLFCLPAVDLWRDLLFSLQSAYIIYNLFILFIFIIYYLYFIFMIIINVDWTQLFQVKLNYPALFDDILRAAYYYLTCRWSGATGSSVQHGDWTAAACAVVTTRRVKSSRVSSPIASWPTATTWWPACPKAPATSTSPNYNPAATTSVNKFKFKFKLN